MPSRARPPRLVFRGHCSRLPQRTNPTLKGRFACSPPRTRKDHHSGLARDCATECFTARHATVAAPTIMAPVGADQKRACEDGQAGVQRSQAQGRQASQSIRRPAFVIRKGDDDPQHAAPKRNDKPATAQRTRVAAAPSEPSTPPSPRQQRLNRLRSSGCTSLASLCRPDERSGNVCLSGAADRRRAQLGTESPSEA